jgi:hypothetical protein
MKNKQKHIENYQKLIDRVYNNIISEGVFEYKNNKNKIIITVIDFHEHVIQVDLIHHTTIAQWDSASVLLQSIKTYIKKSLNKNYSFVIRKHKYNMELGMTM